LPNSVSPGIVILCNLSSTFNHHWTPELCLKKSTKAFRARPESDEPDFL
jgi:hypothetical protein